MKKFAKLMLGFGGLTMLGACAEFAVEDARGLQAGGGAHNETLYSEYLALAELELKERDFSDAIFFAERAQAAANTGGMDPQQVAAREIPADKKGGLAVAYDVLTARIAQGARTDMPVETAKAQAAYECWLQEQEENRQPEHWEACEATFTAEMAKIADFYRPKPAPVVMAKKPEPVPEVAAAPHMEMIEIYFAYDSAELSDSAVTILQGVAGQVQDKGVKMVVIEGFTDTKGNKAYNERLAAARAAAVAAALEANGVPKNQLDIASYGENRPKVATDDEVQHLANRVVTLDFLM